MQKIIWLDDEPESISYERDTLIPDKINMKNIETVSCEKIDEFMEYIQFNEIEYDDIFIIDIMLIGEESILLANDESIEIPDDLMAGTILYTEFLKENFLNNLIVLYTSREHEGELFNRLIRDERYNRTLFLVDKWEKDTKFIDVLKKFIRSSNE